MMFFTSLSQTGYYCKFVQLYTGIAKTLNNLLHKKAPFVLSKECQSCFEQPKEALCKPPILKHPYPAKPYMLFCDVSNYAFTGVLTQVKKILKT